MQVPDVPLTSVATSTFSKILRMLALMLSIACSSSKGLSQSVHFRAVSEFEGCQRLPNLSGDPSVRIEVIYLVPSHPHFAAAPDSNTSVPGFALTPT
ncbi:hypothetical protein BLA17378_02193 [Burkholderia aenigmatica]|uniref:Lipoprotein n=1 Tax=Burkholderia aenigmatica TaxID=2015348 RepID=A0ABY6XP75_9BURK|nr:hypothetical protein BLA17378_02193 [Burkholderia aenigmatica]